MLVVGKKIVGMGYNGAPEGEPHCDDMYVGCMIGQDGRCKRTIHAEINACHYVSINTWQNFEAELWCTHHPCLDCLKYLIAAGIKKVHCFIDYSNPDLIQYLSQLNRGVIEIERHPMEPIEGRELYPVSPP